MFESCKKGIVLDVNITCCCKHSMQAFHKLINLLGNQVLISERKSCGASAGGNPITPQLVVATGMSFLGGEFTTSLEDIMLTCYSYWPEFSTAVLLFILTLCCSFEGMDILLVDQIVDLFLEACLLEANELEIQPPNPADLEQLSQKFMTLSESNGLFAGGIGAIDGWLCCINQPFEAQFFGKRAYFSGHYPRFGLNIHAVILLFYCCCTWENK